MFSALSDAAFYWPISKWATLVRGVTNHTSCSFPWVYFLFPLQHSWAQQSVNQGSLSQGEFMRFYLNISFSLSVLNGAFPSSLSRARICYFGKMQPIFWLISPIFAAGQQQLVGILEQWGQILTQEFQISPLPGGEPEFMKQIWSKWTQVHLESPLPRFNKGRKHSKGRVKWIYLYINGKLKVFFSFSASGGEGIPAFPGGLGQAAVVGFNILLCFGDQISV